MNIQRTKSRFGEARENTESQSRFVLLRSGTPRTYGHESEDVVGERYGAVNVRGVEGESEKEGGDRGKGKYER